MLVRKSIKKIKTNTPKFQKSYHPDFCIQLAVYLTCTNYLLKRLLIGMPMVRRMLVC